MLKVAMEGGNGPNTKYMFGRETIIKKIVLLLADGNITVDDVFEQEKKFFI